VTRVKGGRSPGAGAGREDVVLEAVYWHACTARLPPRLLKCRAHGPVSLTHRLRHSALTYLGEQGTSLLLMAKSRRKKPEIVRRYFKPSAEAIAEVTSPLAPGDSRR
jgi:integrase/recombinase XerC